MRVFVAGGTGAVGEQMVPQMLAAGHQVLAITRRAAGIDFLTRMGAEAITCDVFDREDVKAAILRSMPDAIVHQLTDLPKRMEPRDLHDAYARNNRVRREGTRNLLEAAHAAGVRRFIVQSMATWYRPEGSAVKTETDPMWTDAPEPIGTGVRTVVEMEAAVLSEIPVGIVLRYGGFYGPGTWYAADGDVAGRVRDRGFPIIGSGSGITSFVHVHDAASAAVAALHASASETYNIVDNEPALAAEWMSVYADALGAPPPRHVPELLARIVLGKGLTAWLTTMRGASNAKALRELAWQPAYPSWRTGFHDSLAP